MPDAPRGKRVSARLGAEEITSDTRRHGFSSCLADETMSAKKRSHKVSLVQLHVITKQYFLSLGDWSRVLYNQQSSGK